MGKRPNGRSLNTHFLKEISMTKLKLTVWYRVSQSHAPVYCGVAHDLKSFAALSEACRAGCFGPISRSKFYVEFHDGVSLRNEGMYSLRKGRLALFVPTEVAMNWHLISVRRSDAARLRAFPNLSARVKWDLVPYAFSNPFKDHQV